MNPDCAGAGLGDHEDMTPLAFTPFNRILTFAPVQAKLRARLGDMPGDEQWRQVSGAHDYHLLIERLREIGLPYWVDGLPRQPEPLVIEGHLFEKMRDRLTETVRWLPLSWRKVKHHLLLLPDLFMVKLALHHDDPPLPAQQGGNLAELLALPMEQRHPWVLQSPFVNWYSQGAPEIPWLMDLFKLFHRLPDLHMERRNLHRLKTAIETYLKDTVGLRRDFRHADDKFQRQRYFQQQAWALVETLEYDVKRHFAGDAFFASTLLVYIVLEFIQFAKVRGLLMAAAHDWHVDDAITGSKHVQA